MMSIRRISVRVRAAPLLALLIFGPVARGDQPAGRAAAADSELSSGDSYIFGAYSPRLGTGAGGGFIADLAADSFTLGGLSYADGEKYEAEVRECIVRGLKIAFRLCPRRPDGRRVSTHNDEVAKAAPDQIDAWVEQVRGQIKAVVADPVLDGHVAAWYLMPEELRPSQPREKELLQRLYDSVRALDPRRRPAWMYNPQHSTAERFVELGAWLDYFSMGIYPHHAGNDHNRLQVRHALEQMKLANARLGARKPILPVLEMFASADYPYRPAEAALIASFVRHDAYCALANGASGILVWSFGKRPGFSAYADYYAAWAGIARETRELGLREVFSDGVERDAVALSVVSGPARVPFKWGRFAESYPPLSSRAWEHRGRVYVLVVNSSEEPVGFVLRDTIRRGFSGYRNLLDRELYRFADSSLRLSLPPRGVLVMASEE